jgi:hypothetical protein
MSRVEAPMKNDVTFVLILISFFAVAALFVFACDRIIGRDELELGEETVGEPEPQQPEKLAA